MTPFFSPFALNTHKQKAADRSVLDQSVAVAMSKLAERQKSDEPQMATWCRVKMF